MQYRDHPRNARYEEDEEWERESRESVETPTAFGYALEIIARENLERYYPSFLITRWLRDCQKQDMPPFNKEGIPYTMMEVGWFPPNAEVGIIPREDPYAGHREREEMRRESTVAVLASTDTARVEPDIFSETKTKAEGSLRRLSNSFNGWFMRKE